MIIIVGIICLLITGSLYDDLLKFVYRYELIFNLVYQTLPIKEGTILCLLQIAHL